MNIAAVLPIRRKHPRRPYHQQWVNLPAVRVITRNLVAALAAGLEKKNYYGSLMSLNTR